MSKTIELQLSPRKTILVHEGKVFTATQTRPARMEITLIPERPSGALGRTRKSDIIYIQGKTLPSMERNVRAKLQESDKRYKLRAQLIGHNGKLVIERAWMVSQAKPGHVNSLTREPFVQHFRRLNG